MVIYVNEKLCKGCGICIHICPRNVLKLSKKLTQKGIHIAEASNPEECIKCHLCEYLCPDFAICITT